MDYNSQGVPTVGAEVDFVATEGKATEIFPTRSPTPAFAWKPFLFSFKGRVGRSHYWLRFALPVFFASFVAGFIDGFIGGFMDASGGDTWPPVFTILFSLALLWPSLAVGIKRWHDRDKSGWWILISLIPLVGAIWTLVECGFLKGTTGDNRFGADPVPA
ncbi:MAG: DUF805 domain-containing protein [Rhodospirillaceae bacterium]|nr:DUF805 domain-containing protein [Rhodospirillales bacterium]